MGLTARLAPAARLGVPLRIGVGITARLAAGAGLGLQVVGVPVRVVGDHLCPLQFLVSIRLSCPPEKVKLEHDISSGVVYARSGISESAGFNAWKTIAMLPAQSVGASGLSLVSVTNRKTWRQRRVAIVFAQVGTLAGERVVWEFL